MSHQTETAAFRYIDLFAGIGGFHAVLDSMGGECVYAVEIDKAAQDVYEANWGMRPLGSNDKGDITLDTQTELEVNVPEHDVLVAGFPCQPFSKSGAQKGMDEIRGTLFFDIMRIVNDRKPAVVLLENVRNLAGPRHVHEWDVIIERLRKAGYRVSHTASVLSPVKVAPEFGGHPQTRDRVFIAATRVAPLRPTPEAEEALARGRIVLPDPVQDTDETVKPIALDHLKMQRPWNLMADLPLDEKNVGGSSVSVDEWRWIDHWERLVQRMRAMLAHEADRAGLPAKEIPGFPIWANVWTTDENERRAALEGAAGMAWKVSHLRKNYELYDRLRSYDAFLASTEKGATEKGATEKGATEKVATEKGADEKVATEKGADESRWTPNWLGTTRQFPESRQKMEWQAQDSGSIRDCVISMRPSGLRVKQMTHLPALVAISQTPIIGPLERRLTIEEGTLLQGLPASFKGATWKQLGNGVNTGVVAQALSAQVERDAALLELDERGRRVLAAVRETMRVTGGDLREKIAAAVTRGQAKVSRTDVVEGSRAA
ncbi:DNA (cytosine-5-)-methyltransferase [Oerskovia rustica]|uniref:Cytosine-specific methyltransferase n=1 Tax=Oerskovia rustica TaxID=2762237 RepID=A0ABR8RN63_9CELL|nr:DNA (cytosine-5-)-methyltransferase [Oerskovia rustica]MBD7949234.1 DNA (cytosine-5-)-methyltransferase [Oerskovia rustica]